MLRTLPILVGLTVVLATGFAHGLWTNRWQPSEALAIAEERVASLPHDLGAWKSEPFEQEREGLVMTGAVAHYSRTFTDPVTGDRVLVILLAGPSARMSVHRPEHCYQSVGYEMITAPVQVELQPKNAEKSEFFTSLFSREEMDGPSRMRIFWSFGASGDWSAPTSPRLKYAREKVLYKLYVLRNVTEAATPLRDDPCVRLLGELLPVLDRTLWAE